MAVTTDFTSLNNYITGFQSSLGLETGLFAGLECGPLLVQVNATLN